MKQSTPIRAGAIVAAWLAALTACGSPVTDDPATTASPTSTGSSAAPTAPLATAVPSPAPPPEPFDWLDDGIADSELPPLAPHISDKYPDAHVMEEWVWDKVGPGWALAMYGWDGNVYDPDPTTKDLPQWVYLVSPEGVNFAVVALGSGTEYHTGFSHWRVDERVVFLGPYAPVDDNVETLALDLTTGKLLPGVIDLPQYDLSGAEAGSTQVEWFLGTTTAGQEMWESAVIYTDESFPADGIYTWEPGAGWARWQADVSDLTLIEGPDPSGSALLFRVTPQAGYVSYGDAWLLYATHDDWGPIIRVDSITGVRTEVNPILPPGAFECSVEKWVDEVSIVAQCFMEERAPKTPEGRMPPDTRQATRWRLFIDGSTAAETLSSGMPAEFDVRLTWRSYPSPFEFAQTPAGVAGAESTAVYFLDGAGRHLLASTDDVLLPQGNRFAEPTSFGRGHYFISGHQYQPGAGVLLAFDANSMTTREIIPSKLGPDGVPSAVTGIILYGE